MREDRTFLVAGSGLFYPEIVIPAKAGIQELPTKVSGSPMTPSGMTSRDKGKLAHYLVASTIDFLYAIPV
jgi:hypothetical protein